MTPVAQLQKQATNFVGKPIEFPPHIEYANKFYEGIIACFQCRGVRKLMGDKYEKGSPRQISWQAGWEYAEPIYLRSQGKIEQAELLETKQEFKFMAGVGV